MELTFPAPRVFYDAIRVSWFKRMTAEIDAFADALEAWLYGLRSHPPGQWRERFDQFVAEQEAEGRLLSAEGREQIIDYLDDWAASLRQVDEAPPARFVKTSTNWPALSEEDRLRTYRDYGLPGWYGKPLDWGDAEWEAVFEKLGRESRDRMLEVCQQLTALGRLAKDADNLADDGLEELTSHKQQVQAAYDAYILSLVEIQRQWLDYINRHWFVGLQIQKLIARLEADLPPRLFDLASSHSKALATVANDVNKALGRVTDRLDTAYKTAIWTDRVITAIEMATAVGGGAHIVFKAAIKSGMVKSVAIKVAVKYAVKQMAIQATTYVVAGYTLPRLLAASGLNQDFVFTGLMVMQGLTTLYALRSAMAVKPEPGLEIADNYFEPHPGRMRENIRNADKSTPKTIGKKIETEMEVPLSERRGVWDAEGPGNRGLIKEHELGGNLPDGFKTFDKFDFENGIATSIKSLDTWARTYSDASAILRTCKGYVDKIVNYKRTTRNGLTIAPEDIRERRLDIIVPQHSTPRQREAFNQTIEYGKTWNVVVTFIENQK